ncbi:MAG: hypothetical protein IK018_08485 [Lachnospiraceae bacterium]|nr:hypothetical protein [Lachnospiraceae bacterium]
MKMERTIRGTMSRFAVLMMALIVVLLSPMKKDGSGDENDGTFINSMHEIQLNE